MSAVANIDALSVGGSLSLSTPNGERCVVTGGPPVTSLTGLTTFVFQPGGTAADNVFTDWALLMAAVQKNAGVKSILIDPTFADPVVPPGSWNVDNCQISSFITAGGFISLLTFDDGAKLTGSGIYFSSIILENLGAPVLEYAGGAGAFITLFSCVIAPGSPTAGPFIHVAADAGTFTIFGTNLSEIGDPDRVLSVWQQDSPSDGSEFDLSNHAIVFANAITGTGHLNVVFDSDVNLELPQPVTSLHLEPQSHADFVVYTPTSLPNWSGTSPHNVSVALDRLAAHVGPVP